MASAKEIRTPKDVKLDYNLISVLDGYNLLLIKPKTGRPHQIRVQLAHIGCPIVGDFRYGSTIKGIENNIYLHCRKMEFIHPIKKEKIVIKVDPEGGMWNKFSYDQENVHV